MTPRFMTEKTYATTRSYRYRTMITAFALVGLAVGAFVVPLQTRSGVIDATRNQCPSLPPATKHYHLLFGQLHDYRLVRAHLTTSTVTNSDCGQLATVRLYL